MIAEGPPVDLAAIVARFRGDLETELRRSVPTSHDAPELFDLLRYHLGWLDENLLPTRARGGKLLRPTLCLLSCEAVGGDYHRALPAAAALELLHNFSLIHDDVEDRGHDRHGRATLWARWGEPLAVNAGDALLIVSELALLESPKRGLTAEETLMVARVLNECCLRLTEGQHLDLRLEGNPGITRDQYFQIIARKTSALLGCSTQLGALCGGAQADRAEAFKRFGENVGIGFQIQDDVLGIWGDARVTGKPAAADVAGHKVTLPVIEALEQAPPDVAARIATVYRARAPAEDDVTWVVQGLTSLGVRERAEALARTYVERALDDLALAQPMASPGGALAALAESLLGRKF